MDGLQEWVILIPAIRVHARRHGFHVPEKVDTLAAEAAGLDAGSHGGSP